MLRKARRANLAATDRFPNVTPAWHRPRTNAPRDRSRRGKSEKRQPRASRSGGCYTLGALRLQRWCNMKSPLRREWGSPQLHYCEGGTSLSEPLASGSIVPKRVVPSAKLTISAAVALAALTQPIPVFTGEPQLLTLSGLRPATRVHTEIVVKAIAPAIAPCSWTLIIEGAIKAFASATARWSWTLIIEVATKAFAPATARWSWTLIIAIVRKSAASPITPLTDQAAI